MDTERERQRAVVLRALSEIADADGRVALCSYTPFTVGTVDRKPVSHIEDDGKLAIRRRSNALRCADYSG